MRFKWSVLLVILVLTCCWSLTAEEVLAKNRCRIRVDTILASRNGSGVDVQLKRHIGELQSMFNYTSYRLLGSESLNLKAGQSGTVSLPGSRRLKIIPQNIRGSRADIALTMMKNRRTVFQTQIQLLNHGSLFVGGPTYKDGNLIFKISGSY
jgi:hypothetical protein